MPYKDPETRRQYQHNYYLKRKTGSQSKHGGASVVNEAERIAREADKVANNRPELVARDEIIQVVVEAMAQRQWRRRIGWAAVVIALALATAGLMTAVNALSFMFWFTGD